MRDDEMKLIAGLLNGRGVLSRHIVGEEMRKQGEVCICLFLICLRCMLVDYIHGIVDSIRQLILV